MSCKAQDRAAWHVNILGRHKTLMEFYSVRGRKQLYNTIPLCETFRNTTDKVNYYVGSSISINVMVQYS